MIVGGRRFFLTRCVVVADQCSLKSGLGLGACKAHAGRLCAFIRQNKTT